MRWLTLGALWVAMVGCDVSVGSKDTAATGGGTTPGSTDPGDPPDPEDLPATSGEIVETWTGNIAAGVVIPLDWAESGAIACFPATLNEYYDGGHVFYDTPLDPWTEMIITLGPEAGVDLSLYALQIGEDATIAYPPDVQSAVTCEASPDGSPFNGPGVAESVRLNATDGAYHVVIGVAGAHGATNGAFTLRVALNDEF